MIIKVCTKCKNELPATTEYFPKVTDRKSGLDAQCKKCKYAYCKTYKKNNEEKVNRTYRKWWKLNAKEIREKKKKYWKSNRDKIKKKHKVWCELNLDKIKAQREKYKEQNKDRILMWYKNWYEKNRKYKINYNKEYLKTEKGKQSKKLAGVRTRHKRSSIMKSLLSDFTRKQWLKCLEYFENKCTYCGKKLEPPTLDHFIPVTKNGGLTRENILPVCKSCNSSKNSKDFFKWYPKQEFYNKERELRLINYLRSD